MAKKIKDADGNTYVQKKPFYKKWWFILLVVIVAISALGGEGEEDTASSSNETTEASTSETTEVVEEESSEVVEEDKAFNVGDVVTVGDVDYTVNGVETTQSVGPSIYPTEAKDTFLIVNLTVKNNGNEAIMVDSSSFKLIEGEKSFDADSAGSMYANQDDEGNSLGFFLENLNPDVEMQGKIVFDVTEAQANSETAQLGLSKNMFSSDYTLVNLR